MIKNKYISLIGFIIVTFSASAIGGLTTRIYKEPWYSNIIKPSFNPPDWVFAPVWSTLYLFMSVAIWLIWINEKRTKNIFVIYFVHLFINATWSIFFFGLHQILLSLIVILIIIFFIIWLMRLYFEINKFSFILMVPYLLWCSYAFVLNLSLFILN